MADFLEELRSWSRKALGQKGALQVPAPPGKGVVVGSIGPGSPEGEEGGQLRAPCGPASSSNRGRP